MSYLLRINPLSVDDKSKLTKQYQYSYCHTQYERQVLLYDGIFFLDGSWTLMEIIFILGYRISSMHLYMSLLSRISVSQIGYNH